MRISTRGRYAIRMLIDLAENCDGNAVALKDIAERQDISKKYLEQIVSVLNKGGFLITSRGFQGGYKLAKPPKECILGDILRCTEVNLAPVACLEGDENPCEVSAECPTLPVWEGLNKVINEYLDGITLQDILDQKNERKKK